jgi:hypothetical protein
VDRFGQDYLLILLIVSDNVTRLRRSWKIHTDKESQPSFGGRSGFTLQNGSDGKWNNFGVGLVFSDPKFPDAADRTTILSRVRNAMQAGPTKSVVHEMESKGAVCLGLVCDGDKQNILPGMVGVSAYYPVHMAVLDNHTHAEDSVQLFGRFDKLLGYAHISLSPTSNQQKGDFLRFFATNIALGVDEVTLAKIAIEFPDNHPKDVFSLEAFSPDPMQWISPSPLEVVFAWRISTTPSMAWSKSFRTFSCLSQQ